jgi:hypothetical protein
LNTLKILPKIAKLMMKDRSLLIKDGGIDHICYSKEYWTYIQTIIKMKIKGCYQKYSSAKFHNLSCYLDLFGEGQKS